MALSVIKYKFFLLLNCLDTECLEPPRQRAPYCNSRSLIAGPPFIPSKYSFNKSATVSVFANRYIGVDFVGFLVVLFALADDDGEEEEEEGEEIAELTVELEFLDATFDDDEVATASSFDWDCGRDCSSEAELTLEMEEVTLVVEPERLSFGFTRIVSFLSASVAVALVTLVELSFLLIESNTLLLNSLSLLMSLHLPPKTIRLGDLSDKSLFLLLSLLLLLL